MPLNPPPSRLALWCGYMQAKPAVKRLTGHGVELVALGEDTEEGVLQTLFEISDGSAR